ncbi:lipid A biosynthesis lauroyl acyltransferase [Arcobacter sp. LA11]|uniref:lipid A biosynthesis lauroyl acyltransferase n=1 Tax=Arcobacter sp. LA11 TaxID=1898176 RepID=UPI0009354F55|nr:lipid A biosynthesis lauroyl acyltransferase [Arcobacter sp. LA11]
MKATAKDYFTYFLYILFKLIFQVTPNFILKKILLLIAKLVYKFSKKHKHIAKVNLDLAFENKISIEEKNSIIQESYKSLLFNMYEFIENQSISKEKLLSKANIENEEVILNAIKENRKIIFVTAHYGGWELAIPYIALKYGTLAVVNRKMNNPLINDMYIKARDRNNIIMLEKKVAAKGMIKAFKKNHFVAVAIDQHIRDGIEIEFFNKKILATDSTARLALKFDAVIIPLFAIMNDFRNYTIKVHDIIDSRSIEFKTDNKEKELTQIQADVIEEQILETPSQWFWQHKRWKEYYKDLYKRK